MVLGINILAHIPIQIINAVTLEPEPLFSIHINWVRIVLEPLTGFLLFLLRTGKPLDDFMIFCIWLFVIIGIAYFIKMRDEPLLKPLKYWMLSIPAIAGVALFILVWLIFWPLPSNRIVNHSENIILFNSHAHSHYSHDGLMTPEELMKWHEKNGFDAFFITEHNHNPTTLELVHKQETNEIPKSPHLIAGIEFSGSNHLLLLGLTDTLITFGKKDAFIINEAHKQGALVVVAHWFDGQRKSLEYYIDSDVDGFEIANQNLIAYPAEIHDQIVMLCKENHLFLLSNADYHGYGPTCNTWNALEIPRWRELNHREKTEAILKGLKEGKTKTLFYQDRSNEIRSSLWTSPFYHLMNYFRGLNGYQLLSWFGWGLLLISIKIKWRPLFLIRWIPFFTGMALLIQGRILFSRVEAVLGTNEIYLEYGNLLTYAGFALVASGIILFILLKRFPKLIG